MSFNRTNSNGCPCKGCEDRVPDPNCHGSCEKYKEWQAKLELLNDASRKQREMNNTMSDAKRRSIWKKKRYSRQVRYNKGTKAD